MLAPAQPVSQIPCDSTKQSSGRSVDMVREGIFSPQAFQAALPFIGKAINPSSLDQAETL
jgi:hypothetical protein